MQKFLHLGASMLYKILLFLAILVVAGIVYSNLMRSITKKNLAVASITPPPDLELLDHQPVNINFFKYIQGTIRNNTNTTYKQVQVKVNIFANKTELMGSSSSSAVNLGPGEKWEFQIPILEQGEFSYQFVSITGTQCNDHLINHHIL